MNLWGRKCSPRPTPPPSWLLPSTLAFNGHDFEQTPGDSEGQGNLICCSPWGFKELDTTEQLNNNNNKMTSHLSLTVVPQSHLSADAYI